MTWARQQRAGNATAKAVLLLLGELVGDDGISTRSQTQIAEILECNRDTVGRALTHLEKENLIRRERRQASDTKRLSDRIILIMTETFTVTTLENDVPEPAETEHSNIEHSNIEHSETEQREHANIEQLKDNYLLNPSQTSSAGDGASAAPGELAIPGIPPRQEVAIQGQQGQVADWVSKTVVGPGMPRQAIFKLAQAPLEHGFTANEVACAMRDVWHMDRNLSAQTLARYLQGITRDRQARPKPSTTNQRVEAAVSRAEQYERSGRV